MPIDVLVVIIDYVEPDSKSLDHFAQAYSPVLRILKNNATWLRFIHRRFSTLHCWTHIDLYLCRVKFLRPLYYRLRDIEYCLDDIHNRIGLNLFTYFGSILSENKCFSRSLQLLDIVKTVIYTIVITRVYCDKRDLFYLLNSQKSIKTGEGLSNTRIKVNECGEHLFLYMVFSTNTEHFESFYIPILFNPVKIGRDIDIKFKEDFFKVLLSQLKKYFGSSIKPENSHSGETFSLTSDIFWLGNICCDLRKVYHDTPELISLKSSLLHSEPSGVSTLKDLI